MKLNSSRSGFIQQAGRPTPKPLAVVNAQTAIGASDVIRQPHCPNRDDWRFAEASAKPVVMVEQGRDVACWNVRHSEEARPWAPAGARSSLRPLRFGG